MSEFIHGDVSGFITEKSETKRRDRFMELKDILSLHRP